MHALAISIEHAVAAQNHDSHPGFVKRQDKVPSAVDSAVQLRYRPLGQVAIQYPIKSDVAVERLNEVSVQLELADVLQLHFEFASAGQ